MYEEEILQGGKTTRWENYMVEKKLHGGVNNK